MFSCVFSIFPKMNGLKQLISLMLKCLVSSDKVYVRSSSRHCTDTSVYMRMNFNELYSYQARPSLPFGLYIDLITWSGSVFQAVGPATEKA